jgi:hypothetical protein
VKYDFSPAQPQLLASLGKDYPIEARPLRPYKIADTNVTCTVTQMRMFDAEEPVAPWINEAIETEDDPSLQAGICQYRYFLSQERNSKEQLRQAMINYGAFRLQRLEVLAQLEATDAFEHLKSQAVTAAYTTIMYRLGVVVTRLSAAAFWLGVWEIAGIVCVRRTGDST